jgi:hypothetical protein
LQDGYFLAINDSTENIPSSFCFGALMSFLKPLAQRSETKECEDLRLA